MLVYLLSLLDDENDKALLTEMFERCKYKTKAIALKILPNDYDAEDAVMGAWTNVALHFPTAKKYLSHSWSAFEAWLTVVVKNSARDERRKRKRAPEPIELWDIPSSADTGAESEVQMMMKLIRSMPEQMCSLLEMRIFGEYSFKEIGKSLGCSADTAHRHFNRAIKTLKKQMEMRDE